MERFGQLGEQLLSQPEVEVSIIACPGGMTEATVLSRRLDKEIKDIVKEAAIRINPEKPVPCVSILEGGYNLGAISESAVAHTQSLIKDRSFEQASNYESKCSDENDLVKEMAKLAVAK